MERFTVNIQPPSKDYSRLSQALPAMKGVAIVMIVSYHLWQYNQGLLTISEIGNKLFTGGLKNIAEGLLSVFCLTGAYGVSIFLIASGFGLAASWWRREQATQEIEKQDSFTLLVFWRRRLARILPLYWLAHGLALLLAFVNLKWVTQGEMLQTGSWGTIAALLLSLTTLRNFFVEYTAFLNPAWWYVGTAVQLYLVFPGLVWLGKRWGWSRLLVGSLLTSLAYRAIVIALPFSDKATAVLLRGDFFPSRLFEFVFGIVLAISLLAPNAQHPSYFEQLFHWSKVLLTDRRWLWLNLLFFTVGTALTWAADEGHLLLAIPATLLLAVGEFCLLFQLIDAFPLFDKSYNLLGQYSYGIYLTNMNTLGGLWMLFTALLPSYWVRFPIVVFIVCLVGGCLELVYNWGAKVTQQKQAA